MRLFANPKQITGIARMTKPVIREYTSPAGGWGALEATSKALIEQNIPVHGAATLLHMNQPMGFDCPGCAWPDPKHTSSFEFCENGAKAVAWKQPQSAAHPTSLRNTASRSLRAGATTNSKWSGGSPIRWRMTRRPTITSP